MAKLTSSKTAVSTEEAAKIAAQKKTDAAEKKKATAAAKKDADATVKAAQAAEGAESEDLLIEFEIPNNTTNLPKRTHVVPNSELEHAHVFIEQIRFDPNSGTRTSAGFVQKFDRQAWENARQYLPTQGWTMGVVYMPEGWPTEVKPLTSIGKVEVRDQARPTVTE